MREAENFPPRCAMAGSVLCSLKPAVRAEVANAQDPKLAGHADGRRRARRGRRRRLTSEPAAGGTRHHPLLVDPYPPGFCTRRSRRDWRQSSTHPFSGYASKFRLTHWPPLGPAVTHPAPPNAPLVTEDAGQAKLPSAMEPIPSRRSSHHEATLLDRPLVGRSQDTCPRFATGRNSCTRPTTRTTRRRSYSQCTHGLIEQWRSCAPRRFPAAKQRWTPIR